MAASPKPELGQAARVTDTLEPRRHARFSCRLASLLIDLPLAGHGCRLADGGLAAVGPDAEPIAGSDLDVDRAACAVRDSQQALNARVTSIDDGVAGPRVDHRATGYAEHVSRKHGPVRVTHDSAEARGSSGYQGVGGKSQDSGDDGLEHGGPHRNGGVPRCRARRAASSQNRNSPRRERRGLWFGAPDRIRTCDLLLRRQTLYPLSYRGPERNSTSARPANRNRVELPAERMRHASR